MAKRGFDEAWLAELTAKNDIVSVIGSYIPLTKKGKNYWGRCPFHHEKTPSFAVNAPEQYYHCFGCGASGSVIRFVMEMENIDFYSAVQLLANKVGMTLPEYRADENLVKKKRYKERLLSITKDAAKYYYSNLKSAEGVVALNYLRKRGISDETTVKFGLGLSTGFNGLIDVLHAKGYSNQEMVDAGVAAVKNKTCYDALYNRLIVPIINSYGDVIAFGGRVLEKTTFAKYKNTGDTLIFNKSENLFNLNLLKRVKQAKGLSYVLMVEGYMDVIALVQAGIENVVASMGTALTVQQARILKRYTDTVYISYDGDAAGQTATLRGLDILRTQGLEVRVLSMPKGMDPDEVIREGGLAAYQKLIDDALPLIEYKLRLAEVGLRDSSDSRAKYASRALAVLATVEDETEREAYLSIVKQKSGISVDALKRELFIKVSTAEASVTNEREQSAEAIADESAVASPQYYACARQVLSALICGKLIEGEDLTPYFEDDTHKALYAYVTGKRENGETFAVGELLVKFAENEELDKIVATPYDEKMGTVALERNLTRLKDWYIQGEKAKLVKAIEQESDADKKKALIIRLNNLVVCKR